MSLTDDILLNYDTNAKVAPPIRTQQDKKALISAIKDGTIDCIATDHSPHAIEDKEKDFENASCGMIGLESAFGLVNKTLSKSKVSLHTIINLFTINPSSIINLDWEPLKINADIDLVVINPDVTWKFGKKDIFSKSKNSAFLGQNMKGKVEMILHKNKFFKIS